MWARDDQMQVLSRICWAATKEGSSTVALILMLVLLPSLQSTEDTRDKQRRRRSNCYLNLCELRVAYAWRRTALKRYKYNNDQEACVRQDCKFTRISLLRTPSLYDE